MRNMVQAMLQLALEVPMIQYNPKKVLFNIQLIDDS